MKLAGVWHWVRVQPTASVIHWAALWLYTATVMVGGGHDSKQVLSVSDKPVMSLPDGADDIGVCFCVPEKKAVERSGCE